MESNNGNGAEPHVPEWFKVAIQLDASEIQAFMAREDLGGTEKRLFKSLVLALTSAAHAQQQAQLNGLAVCCLMAKVKARRVHIPANVLQSMPKGTRINVEQGQYGDLHITMDIPEPRILRANSLPRTP